MIIGLFASFLTAVFLTRIVYEALLAKDKLKNVTFTTSITKDLLTNPKINFLAARKVGYLIPAGIIVLGCLLYTSGTVGCRRSFIELSDYDRCFWFRVRYFAGICHVVPECSAVPDVHPYSYQGKIFRDLLRIGRIVYGCR